MISGLLQADEGVIVNSDNCAQLFTHEATRVFHDRLVDTADRTTFYQIISEILHDYFKVYLHLILTLKALNFFNENHKNQRFFFNLKSS